MSLLNYIVIVALVLCDESWTPPFVGGLGLGGSDLLAFHEVMDGDVNYGGKTEAMRLGMPS